MTLNELGTARLFGTLGAAIGALQCVVLLKGDVRFDGVAKIKAEVEDMVDFLMDILEKENAK